MFDDKIPQLANFIQYATCENLSEPTMSSPKYIIEDEEKGEECIDKNWRWCIVE